jgi:hypothetical protein
MVRRRLLSQSTIPIVKKEPKKKVLHVSDEAVARSRAKMTKSIAGIGNPFVYPDHPPGVVPKDAGLAMDDDGCLNSSFSWAQAAFYSTFAEGTTFLGYPYLAELAQRAEYLWISETISTEMTRKWIKIKSKGDSDKTDRIHKIEEAFEKFNVRDAFKKVARHDGLFGRGHLYIDLGVTDDPDELKISIGDVWDDASLSKGKIGKGKLRAIKPVEPVWCYPARYNSNDPLRDDWYNPISWLVMGKDVHSTRFLTFVGREVADLLKPAYSFGGLSMSQIAKPYIDNWLKTRQAAADAARRYSVNCIKTKLDVSMNSDGQELFKRIEFLTNHLNNNGCLAIDKDSEDFFNVSMPLSGLPELQSQAQEHLCAVSRIPVVKLLGIQPAGLNASSEGELTAFGDTISAYQEHLFRRHLNTVLGIVMINEFGEVDKDITFDFLPLEEMNEKELAEIEKMKAETDQMRIDAGILSPMESRTRLAADPDSGYDNIDVDDAPDLRLEEMEGLEPKGARSGEGGEGEEDDGTFDQAA